MIRRPPRSTLDRSSAASDVYKRQARGRPAEDRLSGPHEPRAAHTAQFDHRLRRRVIAVSYTHLRAHETVLDLVCRLLLEKKNNTTIT